MRSPSCERQKFVAEVLETTYSPPVGGVKFTMGTAVLRSLLLQPTCVTRGTLLLNVCGVNGCLPQFLLSRFPKLKMSHCTETLPARAAGNRWRTERSTRCVNGLRQEFRVMIRPRCELRQGEPLMKFSRSCACVVGERVPCWRNWISVASSAFFG